jgi:alkylation response protein AidB-like acyl-CoA dehydrogenase
MVNVDQSVCTPRPDMSADEFRYAARIYLASILGERTGQTAVSLLGAGSDDLEVPRRFLARLARDGWSAPTWPSSLGGVGLGTELASIWQKELSGFSAPDLYPFRIGLSMVGPTVLTHGTPAQERKSGASCSRSLAPDRTWPGFAPWPVASATCGR